MARSQAEREKAARKLVEYRERHKALGLCRICSNPTFKGGFCVKHYEAHLLRKRLGSVVACCGEYGRLKVELYLKLKQMLASDLTPPAERADAQGFFDRAFGEEADRAAERAAGIAALEQKRKVG